MELTKREKIYLKRYQQGSMSKEDFDLYLSKGMITQQFYNFVILGKE